MFFLSRYKKEKELEEKKLRLNVLMLATQELCTEVYSRRQPEYLYTAAAVGALGAVAWGVAAIAPSCKPFYVHPAIFGAIICLLLTVTVVRKICIENKNYMKLRKEQYRLFKLLSDESGVFLRELPRGLRRSCNECIGKGYQHSIWIVFSVGIFTSIFCLIVFFNTRYSVSISCL
ncbi:MAG: hypothetical protein NG784_15365 [Candidatus Jettenia sp.]|nr:hypothetical protein [Candidatus Jettenia sp.]